MSSKASESSVESTYSPDTKPRLFALLIGIDKYATPNSNLTGAVADAQDVKTFLVKKLKVPEGRIKTLYDEKATRDNIIKKFKGLKRERIDSETIRKDDPILIYFAGHGSEVDAPKGWDAERGKVQLILPHDVRKDGNTIINAIADRTIGVLLEEIAKAQSDNITVILDSCHSHSGTRDPTNDVPREIKLEGTLPSDLDSDIRSEDQGRDPFVHPIFVHHSLRSHVLLAACSSQGKAFEGGQRGHFTKALIQKLREVGIRNVTYGDLVDRLLPNLPNSQIPHCEGHHKDRLLFDVKTADNSFIPVTKDGPTLLAGDAHGIIPESEFDVFTDHLPESTLIGRFRATVVEPTNTTLEGPASAALPDLVWAKLVSYAFPTALRLKVYFSKKFEEKFVAKILDQAEAGDVAIEGKKYDNRNDKDSATLLVACEGNKAAYQMRIGRKGRLERLDDSTPADSAERIADMLRLAGHWNWHFKREGSDPTIWSEDVKVKFYRLKQVNANFDDKSRLIWCPVEPRHDLNKDGVINIPNTGSDCRYGMEVKNDTIHDLYAYLFYFGAKNLKIIDYKLGATGKGKIDPTLLGKSSLEVGYGASGVPPFTFKLFPGMPKANRPGFFKIFLTTSPTNFDSLVRVSPFNPSRDPDQTYPWWGAVTVKVLERFAA